MCDEECGNSHQHTLHRGVRIEIEWFPCDVELIICVWIALLEDLDGFIKLLLADIAPGTDSVAHNLDIELCHVDSCSME